MLCLWKTDLFQENELEQKREHLKNHNTIKANEKAHRIFTNWLAIRKLDLNYWDFSVEELDKHLTKFWFEARTEEGDHYKTGSLGALRYGINRNIQN